MRTLPWWTTLQDKENATVRFARTSRITHQCQVYRVCKYARSGKFTVGPELPIGPPQVHIPQFKTFIFGYFWPLRGVHFGDPNQISTIKNHTMLCLLYLRFPAVPCCRGSANVKASASQRKKISSAQGAPRSERTIPSLSPD